MMSDSDDDYDEVEEIVANFIEDIELGIIVQQRINQPSIQVRLEDL